MVSREEIKTELEEEKRKEVVRGIQAKRPKRISWYDGPHLFISSHTNSWGKVGDHRVPLLATCGANQKHGFHQYWKRDR